MPSKFRPGGDYLQIVESEDQVMSTISNVVTPLEENNENPNKNELLKRERYCAAQTIEHFEIPVSAMFVRETFHGDSKNKAEQIVEEIRKALKNNFKRRNWIDMETRTKAEMKLDSITQLIGYPSYILDPNQLDEKYKDLHVDKKQYLENIFRMQIQDLKDTLELFHHPVNQLGFNIKPFEANAYYLPVTNELGIPVGILQWPFYHTDNPKSLIYGALGVLAGHEVN